MWRLAVQLPPDLGERPELPDVLSVTGDMDSLRFRYPRISEHRCVLHLLSCPRRITGFRRSFQALVHCRDAS